MRLDPALHETTPISALRMTALSLIVWLPIEATPELPDVDAVVPSRRARTVARARRLVEAEARRLAVHGAVPGWGWCWA